MSHVDVGCDPPVEMPQGLSTNHVAPRPLPLQPDGPNPTSNPVLLMIGHMIYLARATAIAWWKHAPWLLGFMLLAMTARSMSLLVTSQIVTKYPFFVMFGPSFGIMLDMAITVLAIRSMGSYLGMRDDQLRPSIRRILESTLLPFMLIYLTFGYVTNYTSNIMYLVQARFQYAQLAELLAALNPIATAHARWTTLIIFVVSFLLGYLVTWLQNKTAASWLSIVSAFLSTVRWVLGVFSLFRVWEQVRFWLYDREFSLWGQKFVTWLSSQIHINIPAVWSDIWGFFVEYVWHGMWSLLAFPLVWFALIIVVAGGQFLSANAVFERVLHADAETRVTFLRRELINRAIGGLSDRVFPIFRALRDTTKATLPFLGAYVVGFSVLTWVGDGFSRVADIIIGARPDAVVMAVSPFVELVPSVLIMSLQIALLAVTYQRATELARMPAPPRRLIAHQGLAVALVCAALVTVQGVATGGLNVTVHTVPMGEAVRFQQTTATVPAVRVGAFTQNGSQIDLTDRMFVVVTAAVQTDIDARRFYVELVAGGHTYQTYDYVQMLSTTPGFRTLDDFVFEVNPGDLLGPVFVQVRPSVGPYMQREVARFRVGPATLRPEAAPIEVNTTERNELP
ncbi:MAG: hypothetical protein FWD63_04215 [Propionibacteriaceae bacterium]|nr:hypothetical protein [Propionibacteriaceae bacterium]